MKKPEQRLWAWLRPKLAPYGRVSRVENPLDPGMPDVSYCINGVEGWIELKVATWPARPDGIVGRGLIRPAQRAWWAKQLNAGGWTFILLRITGRQVEHLLLDGEGAMKGIGTFSLTLLKQKALYWWSSERDWTQYNTHELISQLTGKWPS